MFEEEKVKERHWIREAESERYIKDRHIAVNRSFMKDSNRKIRFKRGEIRQIKDVERERKRDN